MSVIDDARHPAPGFGASSEGADLSGLGGRLFARLLRPLAEGRLKVVLPSGASFVCDGARQGPRATLRLRRWRGLLRILAGGDIGFAEGFIAGDWTTPDLPGLMRLLARNHRALREVIDGSAALRRVERLRHLLRRNSRRGSRRNIEAHYDLGNDFYRLWLDPSMLYSSALYDESTPDLESAQAAKLRRIAEWLDPPGQARVLEIGCGWGALAEYLARDRGARVTGVTLSPAQLAFARARLAPEEGSGQAELRLQDYRDIGESYDRVVSVEMFEAVGEAYWPAFFSTLRRVLNPGGRAVLQVISIAEDGFEAYRRGADFIQKYIFPGGFLPSPSALSAAASREGLRVERRMFFGASYAETLAEWRRRFNAAWPRVAEQGFDRRFRRLWNYYLAYCEAGFREGLIDVGLYALVREEDAP
jgi:cyclopropane-fatty-acyl-phospholipid synthase